MKISCVIPVYNTDKIRLTSAVESIFCQTYKDVEVILVDDGSKDPTYIQEVYESFKESADEDSLKLIRIPHSGLPAARNAGYKIATGDLFVIQDADDMSLPDRFQRAVDYFTTHPDTDVFYHSIYSTFKDSKRSVPMWIKKGIEPLDKERLLREQYIPVFCFFKPHVWKTKPFREECRWADDWAQLLDWAFSDFKFGCEDVATYIYIRHKDSSAARWETTGKRLISLRKIKEIMKKEYNQEFSSLEV